MKFLKILYFHVYNSYYKDGDYTNDIPHLTAFGIAGSALSLLSVSIINGIKYLLTGYKLSTQGYLGVVLPLLILLYFIFVHKRKYTIIYQTLKGSAWDNRSIKTVVWIIIFMGFVSFAMSAFIFKKYLK